ncbi:ABC transporter substrate-binding protein [Aquincola sp. MAHUQ-54]|uniref:ABC transporter substrate-binding protein n=1 Tax=Aquincola agrisoli TaxID=3119538 RepID=A0AAW9QAY3_9BURK
MQRRSLIATTAAACALAALAPLAHAQDATLRFSWWGGGERHESTLKAIAAFEAKNPGVKIKGEYMGFNGYQERLSTQIAGGSEPDIMQINWAWLASYSKSGEGFLDLHKHRALLGLDQFSPEELKMGEVRGKLNALPVSYSARVFVWNKSTFDRAGVPLPKTWDDVFAAGKALQGKLGDKVFAMDGEPYDVILASLAYVQQKHGTPYVSPTEPKVAMSPQALLEWVQTYKRFTDAKVATPLPYRASLGGAEKPTEQQQDWTNGNWAGNYTWDSVLPLRTSSLDKQQKLVIGEFPTLPGAKNSGMFGRPSLMFSVSKRSKHPEVAARFLSFLLTDPEAGRILGLSRGVPAADSQFQALVKDSRIGPLELAAYTQIKQQNEAGRIDLPSPLFENQRFSKFMREVFETVAYGKATEQDAAKRLLEEGNALLNRIK